MADDRLGMRLTNVGAALLARTLAGEQLTFTRGAFGDSFQGTELIQPDTAQQAERESLINERLSLPLIKITPTGAYAEIDMQIQNAQVDNSFMISEIGLFAKIGDEEEQLYGYFNAGLKGDYMPAARSAIAKDYIYTVIISIGNAENVTAIINRSDYELPTATASIKGGIKLGAEFRTFAEELRLTGQINSDVNIASGKGMSLSRADVLVHNRSTVTAENDIIRLYDSTVVSARDDTTNFNLYNVNIALGDDTHPASVDAANALVTLTSASINAANLSVGGSVIDSSPVNLNLPVKANQSVSLYGGATFNENSTIDARKTSINVSDATIKGLPVASATQLGCVKVGSNLYTENGMLKATKGTLSMDGNVLKASAGTLAMNGDTLNLTLQDSGDQYLTNPVDGDLTVNGSLLVQNGATVQSDAQIGGNLSVNGGTINLNDINSSNGGTINLSSTVLGGTGGTIDLRGQTGGTIKLNGYAAGNAADGTMQRGNGGTIDLHGANGGRGGTINLAGTGGVDRAGSITGSPYFTNGFYIGGNRITDIKIENGKLKIAIDGTTYSFTPDN